MKHFATKHHVYIASYFLLYSLQLLFISVSIKEPRRSTPIRVPDTFKRGVPRFTAKHFQLFCPSGLLRRTVDGGSKLQR